MPFTPYHFGPGLLLKSVAPARFSFIAYAAAQVVIDLESGYFLFTSQPPFHRTLHTMLVGGAVGTVVGVATGAIAGKLVPFVTTSASQAIRAESSTWPAVWGGCIGGLLHVTLDGIMHTDIHPFRPFTDANPLQGVIGLQALHFGCVLIGVVGLAVLALRTRRGGSKR